MSFGEGDLHERVGQLESLVRQLESLVLDMHESMRTVSETWTEDMYAERMAALGLLEGGE